jgi:ring-1,2-phenylacetyl-CoA epoxidase subunit PaaC
MSVVDAGVGVSSLVRRDYVLGHADRAMVLAQQLCGLVTHLPDFDEDLAISNIALDLLGQARALYSHAGVIEGEQRSEDDLAFLRDADDFRNPRLVEQGSADFAEVIVRQFLHDSYAKLLWDGLQTSSDPMLAGIAAKAIKETRYHIRYGIDWMIRLGDGTVLSHHKVQAALDGLWPYALELFDERIDPQLLEAKIAIDGVTLRPAFLAHVDTVLAQASLVRPSGETLRTPPRNRAHLASLLTVMQAEYRAHPGAVW